MSAKVYENAGQPGWTWLPGRRAWIHHSWILRPLGPHPAPRTSLSNPNRKPGTASFSPRSTEKSFLIFQSTIKAPYG